MKLATTVRSGMMGMILAVMCLAVTLAPLAGCTPAQKQTTLQVITEINAKAPAVTAAADTVIATISALDPSEAILLQVGGVAFDTLSQTIQSLTAAYIANPNATTLAQIQTAIATLEANVNTAALNAFGIKNATHQQLAIAALKGLLTAATIVFGLITPTMSALQLYRLRETNTIHLAKTRPYMNQRELQQAADEQGVDLDDAFRQAEAFGF